jgi:CubicO group peptidase (beta-lactamase class C family)
MASSYAGRYRRTAVAAVLCVASLASPLSGAGQAAEAGLTAAQASTVTTIVHRAMAAQEIPGLAIEVAIAGRPVYARGFGVRSPGRIVTAATIFPIGSVTKQFTAACVVLLAQDHSLDLDSPVSRYLPAAPHGDRVTVRQLLDQTSGLADYSAQPALQSAVGKDKLTEIAPARLLAMIAGKPLKFTPGTRFDYSNTNYLLAGMIVEAVSGEPLGTFLRERITEPLGMRATQYLRTSIPAGSDVARDYGVKNGRATVVRRITMSWAQGAGALASDAHDVVTWDDAFFHGRVVTPDLVRTMTTRVREDYGYGWVVETVHGEPMIWHNGEIPGAHAMNAYFPRSNMEVVVLTNLGTAKPEEIAKDVAVALRRRAR